LGVLPVIWALATLSQQSSNLAIQNPEVPLHAVARPAQSESANPPVLVLLHGLAADEYDLIGLADELSPEWFAVSYRAPHLTGYGGYSWFGIQFLADGSRLIDEDQALESRELLIQELKLLPDALGFKPSRFVLAGFSQGAMMASGILFKEPRIADAYWLMSGRLVPQFVIPQISSDPKPVLAQHGLYDEVLPVTEGRELATQIRDIGHRLETHEYPMGHQISAASLDDARAWLANILL
jgi:phospholipase/carboxylesterase